MQFILENLGLTLAISIVGVFYRSYKVHLSLIIGSIVTDLYKIVNLLFYFKALKVNI